MRSRIALTSAAVAASAMLALAPTGDAASGEAQFTFEDPAIACAGGEVVGAAYLDSPADGTVTAFWSANGGTFLEGDTVRTYPGRQHLRPHRAIEVDGTTWTLTLEYNAFNDHQFRRAVSAPVSITCGDPAPAAEAPPTEGGGSGIPEPLGGIIDTILGLLTGGGGGGGGGTPEVPGLPGGAPGVPDLPIPV